ncbi:zinc finger protein 830 [Leptinotarsa decemlineata]|uniref:zinc finger protein 830 n=1 Tax=Leptinotarsa decemlineata TaxID=7539 RepID=UPI003D307466
MSATFKNAKKKLSQSELRKFMNEHKTKAKDVKKIESPLAKYNDQGQLTCILCKSVVRSEAVWTIHINAKQHKQNVEIAKKLKERTNNFTTPLKRPLTPPLPDVPTKKFKSILKNSTSDTSTQSLVGSTNGLEAEENKLPDDFFDSKNSNRTSPFKKKDGNPTESDVVPENKDPLPEGFFDDPKLDAKARNQEYRDPIEEEWEKFVRAIKDADSESNAIIAEDQTEATTERQIHEIEEQMQNFARVLDWKKEKDEFRLHIKPKSTNESESESDDDDDISEDFDWRSKHS